MSASELRADLRRLMQRRAAAGLSDDDFNTYALRSFEHQFELNIPYRKYCERRDRTPAHVDHWTHIPAVPTAAFKEVALVAGNPADAVLAFKTSGTTRGAERRGTHYIIDSSLYDVSLRQTFDAFVRPDQLDLRLLSLVPPSAEQPDSSLSYMISALVERADDFYASSVAGLDIERLHGTLRECETKGLPVCLLGTSLTYGHWLERMGGATWSLPAGSRLMDTGGFKGETRAIEPAELRARYEQQLRIPPRYCINEYGMTELCSQYYDASLRDQASVRDVAVKQGAPWLRARVVDPDTLQPLAHGATGILQHFDLANLDSVSAVITEDLAYEVDNGFVLLGRAPGATPRGCSIAMDMLLADVQSGR